VTCKNSNIKKKLKRHIFCKIAGAILQMKARAWNDDMPYSTSYNDFYFPPGTNIDGVWKRRIEEYASDKKLHVKQYYKEIVALKLICREYKLPKDMFNLIRDKHIRRPVEKRIRDWVGLGLPVRSDFELVITGVMTLFLLFAVFLMLGLCVQEVMFNNHAQPNTNQRPLVWNCENTNGNGLPLCVLTSADHVQGPQGPPGFCEQNVANLKNN